MAVVFAVLGYATSGCVGAEADFASLETDTAENVASEPAQSALHAAAVSARVDETHGFCENGLGMYLSATANSAALTVYVVTPAEVVTFEHPILRVTLSDGDSQTTVVREFETVTLEAGESRTFSEYAEGTLLNVVAELDAL
jgi:hypothetical protein